MTNFRVIEDPTPKWHYQYYEFIEAYNNPNITKRELLKKLDWSQNQYNQAREQAIKEKKIPEIRRPKKFKYYRRNKTGYIVEKRTQGKIIRGYAHTEKEAKKLVEYLHKHGWNKENILKFKERP